MVPIGASIDAPFTDLHWRTRRLAHLGPREAFVIYFATVECPIVGRTLPRLGEIARDYATRDVATLVMNVGAGDAFVDAAAQTTEHAPQAYFGKDFDHSFARACGVLRTNTVVVLDRDHKLRYRGRIDDQDGYTGTREQASRADLRCALDDVLAKRAAAVPETEASGCRLTPPAALDPAKVPTYTRDLAPILARTCLYCHLRDPAGGVSLANEADVAKHAAMIAEVVSNGRMPPWRAAAAPGTFVNRRSLSLAERETVRAWIAGGMPRGEDRVPNFHKVHPPWLVGHVSLVIDAAEAVQVPATGALPYQYIELPHEFGAETWVEAIEVRSQQPRALHHCNLAIVPKGTSFAPDRLVANFTPHGAPFEVATGSALRVPAGSVIALQAYYTAIGRAVVDRLQVGVRFASQPVQHEVRVASFGNAAFEVPPHAAAHRVEAAGTLPAAAEGIRIFAHMHGRGRDVMVFADGADGAATPLLTIPAYDFRGQESYVWRPGARHFAAGTRIRAVAHFDNSAWNPNNPDPSQVVRCGPRVADEQMQVALTMRERIAGAAIAVDPATGTRVATAALPAGK